MSLTIKALYFTSATSAVVSFPAVMRQTTSLTGRTTTEGMSATIAPVHTANANAVEDTPANRARLALAGVVYIVGKCIIDHAERDTLAPEMTEREERNREHFRKERDTDYEMRSELRRLRRVVADAGLDVVASDDFSK